MIIIWLGQAGLYFETDSGTKIMIDPYLSNSCGEKNPASFRRLPVDESFFKIKPDVLIFTHNHLDHYDPQTVSRFLNKESKITVLSPFSVWDDVRKCGGSNNFVLLEELTEWTENDVKIKAVKAFHSDPYAIGIILSFGEKTFYVTGDTLYNESIFKNLPTEIDVLFLPINGKGNNMNAADASRFAAKINAKHAIPLHYGMFDEISPCIFNNEKRLIAEPYVDFSEKI